MESVDRRRRWQLVLPHRPYLVRIAVGRGMSWHDAEDCAQEAMLRCVGFANLDESRVLEFLVTTTTRLCVDRHRVQQRDVRLGAKLAPALSVHDPSPEEHACDRAEATWVAAHVATLPESQRAALVARADGLNGHEIAARMGLSYKAVESLLSRARAYVRAAVATAFVLLYRLRRRGLDLPDGAGAITLAALVTAAALAGYGGRAAPPPAAALSRPSAPTVLARGTSGQLGGPPDAPVRVAPASPVPTPPVPPPTPPPGGSALPLPLPTPVPTDPCDVWVPHVEMCLPPVDDYHPGEELQNCLDHGVAIDPPGIECRSSKQS